MRQPALDESRRERWEGWGIELSVLGMLFIIVVGTIWESSLPAVENIALLVPVVLDLLLLAALYNAIRRSVAEPQDGLHLVRLRVHRPRPDRLHGDVTW